ncbi:hypothetical protein D9Q98_004367 [Chlorella vulgaris]|uniref:Uncharacterized protein n=1 Tax=Chlorella vulgaris TaxID=3077 RepID=A0A9D4TPI3_CHLVU|nr:hypothetical protein D9Q98_004367 [Chlorella vulgaris]
MVHSLHLAGTACVTLRSQRHAAAVPARQGALVRLGRAPAWQRPQGGGGKAARGRQATVVHTADFVLVPWDVEGETWDKEAELRMLALMNRFKAADLDGNGVIDRDELQKMLERVGDGEDEVPMHWLTEEDIDGVMAQYDTNGDGVISFEEFVRLGQDKIFLTGKLEEYCTAFKAADSGGDGTISATELFQLFQQLGNPVSYEKLVKIFEAYDVDASGVIDFPEFLRMFRHQLLDLQAIMAYIKQRTEESDAKHAQNSAAAAAAAAAATAAAVAASSAAAQPAAAAPPLTPGAVKLVFGEEEFDAVLAANTDKLVVLMASVTWCKPCKGFQETYEQAARHYTDAVFLKFYGNSNESTKALFKERLKARTTPAFFFFRGGQVAASCSGAVAKRFETNLRKAYGGEVEQDMLWVTEADMAPATA